MTVARRTVLAAGLAALARPARAEPGVLRYGLSAFPPSLQPWANAGSAAGTVKLLTHRSLVSYDRTGELAPELAESWSSDGNDWTFRLRPGAMFHNGEPVTADDVKWTIEQVAAERSTAYLRGQFQEIARIEAPDPATIRLTTKTRQVTLPTWFGSYNMAVIWRNSAPADPVGAGPFTLAAQERGTSLRLEAFGRYYKPGLPKLRAIDMVVYADENLRSAALETGDVDMIEYVPWQSMAAVEATPRLRLDAVEGPFMCVLFNGAKPPFNDPRVRQAIAFGIRRDEIVKAAFFGRGRPLEGVPMIEGTPWFDPALARGWAYDPGRARSLLNAAGFGDGFQTTLLATAQYGMHKDTAQIVQQHLAEIGVRCELQLPDWSTRVARGNRGQYNVAIHGLAADNNDPDGLSPLLDMTLPPAQGRSANLAAPRTAAALARGRAEPDQGARVAIYREMQQAALEEAPLVGLAWRSQGYAMDRRVAGFTNLPGGLSTSSGGMLEETSMGAA